VVCVDEGIAVPAGLDGLAGLVFMGGPGNVDEPTVWMKQELDLILRAVERQIPVLGICLGAQLISKALGGEISPAPTMEVGWHPVDVVEPPEGSSWFAGLPARFEVFQWHAHRFSLPPGAFPLARSECAGLQAFAVGNVLALQFHLEMTPASIASLVRRYPGDLEPVSDCVQSAAAMTENLTDRVDRLYRIADVVFARWLQGVSKG